MRLLCWADQFHPYIGGVEVLIANALPRLQREGFECAVVTSRGPLNLPEEGRYRSIPVYRFPFRETIESRDPRETQLLVRRLVELENRLAPDLVHVFLSDPSCLFHLMARRTPQSRLIVSVHNSSSDMRASAQHSLQSRALQEADWVVGNSAFTLARLHRLAPECVDRSSVIYSGVEPPNDKPSEPSTSRAHIVCVGRLVEKKGFDLPIAAIEKLRARHPQARLEVIGDGPARTALEGLCDALGIRALVDFPGWVDPSEVFHHLDRASVVVVPSRRDEALGQVAIQASFMGRPIVAARLGGLPEVVVHEETGLLVEPNDSAALAAALAWVLDHPREAKAMGERAMKRAHSMFTMNGYCDSISSLYRAVGGS
jgi:glycosyltransferase involved in cell wall biosynthesis